MQMVLRVVNAQGSGGLCARDCVQGHRRLRRMPSMWEGAPPSRRSIGSGGDDTTTHRGSVPGSLLAGRLARRACAERRVRCAESDHASSAQQHSCGRKRPGTGVPQRDVLQECVPRWPSRADEGLSTNADTHHESEHAQTATCTDALRAKWYARLAHQNLPYGPAGAFVQGVTVVPRKVSTSADDIRHGMLMGTRLFHAHANLRLFQPYVWLQSPCIASKNAWSPHERFFPHVPPNRPCW